MRQRTKNRLLINYFFAVSSERLQGLPAFKHLTTATILVALLTGWFWESFTEAALYLAAPLGLYVLALVVMFVAATPERKEIINVKGRYNGTNRTD